MTISSEERVESLIHPVAQNLRARFSAFRGIRYGGRVALSLFAATALVFLTNGVAHADAYGFTPCTSVAGGDRPSCVFEHGITGKGLRVSEEFAEAEGLPATLCNTRIDFQYSDNEGRVYRTLRSSEVQSGCGPIVTRRVRSEYLQPGKACAQLYSAGDLVATQCHRIFA